MRDIVERLREPLTGEPTDEAMFVRIARERADAASEIQRLRGLLRYVATIAESAADFGNG
jgi:hypothetical protein